MIYHVTAFSERDRSRLPALQLEHAVDFRVLAYKDCN